MDYLIELICFNVHKLVIEVDEDDHACYGEGNDQIRQNEIENLSFTFIRINPDVKNFKIKIDVEIAKIYNYINKSSVRLAVNSTEKSLKEKFAKELLSYMSRISKPLKYIRYFIKKTLPFL